VCPVRNGLAMDNEIPPLMDAARCFHCTAIRTNDVWFKRGDPTRPITVKRAPKLLQWDLVMGCRNVSVNTRELCIFVRSNACWYLLCLDAESTFDPTMFVPSSGNRRHLLKILIRMKTGSKALFVINYLIFTRLAFGIYKGGNETRCKLATNFYIV